jgi:hypothetical protein
MRRHGLWGDLSLKSENFEKRQCSHKRMILLEITRIEVNPSNQIGTFLPTWEFFKTSLLFSEISEWLPLHQRLSKRKSRGSHQAHQRHRITCTKNEKRNKTTPCHKHEKNDSVASAATKLEWIMDRVWSKESCSHTQRDRAASEVVKIASFDYRCKYIGSLQGSKVTGSQHHITVITSHHTTSDRIASHHITSHRIGSHRITPHHITSHHIRSHRITS